MISISKRSVITRQLVGECLSTHQLDKIDILFALSHDHSDIADNQLATLAMHLCLNTYVGKYSLSFNYRIDNALKNKDSHEYIRLLEYNSKQAFPEYYEQKDNFSPTQNESIERTVLLEYNTLFRVVKELAKLEFPLKHYIINSCTAVNNNEIVSSKFCDGGIIAHPAHSHSGFAHNPFSNKTYTTLYSEMFDLICNKMKIDSVYPIRYDESLWITENTQISNGQQLKSIQNVNEMELVRFLALGVNGETSINPTTGKPFSTRMNSILKHRFQIQIAFYKYYLNNK